MVVAVASPLRSSSPPVPVLDRPPPLHSDRSNTCSSISTVLGTPPNESTPFSSLQRLSKRATSTPPSSYIDKRLSSQSAGFFDGKQDTRRQFLKLKELDAEWEIIDFPNKGEQNPPTRKRRTSFRAAMSTAAEPARDGAGKKQGGFFRRLTNSGPPPSKRPPVTVPDSAPQLPRLSTLLTDDNAPNIHPQAVVTAGPAQGAMGHAREPSFGLMSGTKFSTTTPPRVDTPPRAKAQPSLPPGAAAAVVSPHSSPPRNAPTRNGPPAQQPREVEVQPLQWGANPSSGFKVSSRPGAPVPNKSRPLPTTVPNGSAASHMPNGHGLPNGVPSKSHVNGLPNGMSAPIPNGARSPSPNGGMAMPQPYGGARPPASPYGARPPPQQQRPGGPIPMPNGAPMMNPPMKNAPIPALASPPTSPLDAHYQSYNIDVIKGQSPQTYTRPPLLNSNNGNGAMSPPPLSPGPKPLPVPRAPGMTNGYSHSPPSTPPVAGRFGQSGQMQYAQQQLPSLPPGAQPSYQAQSPPTSNQGHQMGPRSQSAQGQYQRPSSAQGQNQQYPGGPGGPRAPSAQGQYQQQPPRAPSAQGQYQQQPPRAPSAQGQYQQHPQGQFSPPTGPRAPPQQQYPTGNRPPPAPPAANGGHGAMNALSPSANSQAAHPNAPMISPPARSTSHGQITSPTSPDSRPLPHAPGNTASPPMPRGPQHSNAGATIEVIASSRPAHQQPARPTIVIPNTNKASSHPPKGVPYQQPSAASNALAAAVTAPPPSKTTPAPVGAAKAATPASDLASPTDISFSKSPSINKIVDPRTRQPHTGANGIGNGLPSAIAANALPPRTKSATVAARRIASSPLASPIDSPKHRAIEAIQQRSVSASAAGSTTPAGTPPGGSVNNSPTSSTTQRPGSSGSRVSIMNRGRPKLRSYEKTLTHLLSHAPITATLLPYININTFLNLVGSDPELRKFISGEMVGRWVMREWGVTVDRERGRSWPGLTVWEGFLESLLHDPAVYSTYPAQYHNLLRHLSLSHTLIVLFLRTLPASAFPYSPPLPFDDDIQLPVLHKSSSVGSLRAPRRPGSRAASACGSDSGSHAGSQYGGGKMPRREHVSEVVMPEPLSATPKDAPTGVRSLAGSMAGSLPSKVRRRGSIGSIASVSNSLSFGRKRANSTAGMSMSSDAFQSAPSSLQPASPLPQGKAAFPPVSYPTAKRYEFRSYGGSSLHPLSTPTHSRPGSIMTAADSNMGHGTLAAMSASGHGSNLGDDSLPAPPPIGGGSFGGRSATSSEGGRSSSRAGRSDRNGSNSPVNRRWSPMGSSSNLTGGSRYEPAFDRPPPYMAGRAPILRVFVPVSDRVRRWPSAEGAAVSWRELEKCGANKRMRLGDLVVNTALHKPTNTEHVLVYVPFVQHKLVPLEYVHCKTGHLPHYLDAFALSPTYYDPFLPQPQIVYLDFAPFAQQAMNTLRLAYDRRDLTVASGARVSAKRYLHVAGIEITPNDRVAPDWQGMISLEAEGTAEGRADMEARFGNGNPSRAVMGAWEIVRDRSMLGSLWLRLVREPRN